MKMRTLSTELQTLCHEGHSDDEIYIKINGLFYPIKSLEKTTDETKTFFSVIGEIK